MSIVNTLDRPLTRRERECALAACSGRNAKQIGRAMGISHRTVEGYWCTAARKLGVRGKFGVAIATIRAGVAEGVT